MLDDSPGERQSPHAVLDRLGIPRAGAFTCYSLNDRLRILRHNAAGRSEMAESLLDQLGASRRFPIPDDPMPPVTVLAPSPASGPPGPDVAGLAADVATMRREIAELRDEVAHLLRGLAAPPPPTDGLDVVEQPPVPATPLRRRRVWVLIVLAVVIGVIIAGAAILISVVGWNQLRTQIVGLASPRPLTPQGR